MEKMESGWMDGMQTLRLSSTWGPLLHIPQRRRMYVCMYVYAIVLLCTPKAIVIVIGTVLAVDVGDV